MNLFGIEQPSQTGFDFPQSLTEKYRPARIADFAGLDKPKKILTRFAANPRPIGFFFLGSAGTGKTSMALALAREIGAEVHHMPSQTCTLAALERTVYSCHFVPMAGCRFHMILIDEADGMSKAAQDFCLSRLDGTAPVPLTIFVFTANAHDRLEDRFMSRNLLLEFSTYGIQSDASELLQRAWFGEGGKSTNMPNFARIIKEACGNVRESLMRLETELLAA